MMSRFSGMGYNRPMNYMSNTNQMNQLNPNQQQQGFKQEYQSVLQGMQSLLTIFGKIFYQMTQNIVITIKSTVYSGFDKLLNLMKIRQILKGEIKLQNVGQHIVQGAQDMSQRWLVVLQGLLLLVTLGIAYVLYQLQQAVKAKRVDSQKVEEPQVEVLEESLFDNQNEIQSEEWTRKPEPQQETIIQSASGSQINNQINSQNFLLDLQIPISTNKPWQK